MPKYFTTIDKKVIFNGNTILFSANRISIITIIFIPTIVTFSQMHENQNSNNIPFTNNSNKSQITIVTNSTLLKQLGLYTLSQHLNKAISNLMTIAEASMNKSNSFGKLPQVNLTSEMKIKYHGIPSDQDPEKRNEAKKLLENNKALLYVGLLLPNGVVILVSRISHIKLIVL